MSTMSPSRRSVFPSRAHLASDPICERKTGDQQGACFISTGRLDCWGCFAVPREQAPSPRVYLQPTIPFLGAWQLDYLSEGRCDLERQRKGHSFLHFIFLLSIKWATQRSPALDHSCTCARNRLPSTSITSHPSRSDIVSNLQKSESTKVSELISERKAMFSSSCVTVRMR